MEKKNKRKITATYKCRSCVSKICTTELFLLCTSTEIRFSAPTKCIQGLVPDTAKWELYDIEVKK